MGGARGNQVLPRGEGAEGVAVAGGARKDSRCYPRYLLPIT